MIDLQFYPTPAKLAELAYSKFKRPVVRLLEPSAGKGDLLIEGVMSRSNKGFKGTKYEMTRDEFFASNRRHSAYDVIEIDPENAATLKGYGLNLVGYDFFGMTNGAAYSHILMNPPFANGVDHVLHAWDILRSGEVVAIVNAETVKNPNSAKRELLVKLINDHGSVEFVQDSFTVDAGAKRTTNVEVAVIYLDKNPERKEFDFSSMMQSSIPTLRVEHEAQEVGFKKSTVDALVSAYSDAVAALEIALVARVKADKHEKALGKTLREIAEEEAKRDELGAAYVPPERKDYNYDFSNGIARLKEKGWSSVFRSLNLRDGLSSKVSSDIEKSMKEVSSFDFNTANIYAFLDSIFANRSDLLNDAVCDIFDRISAYHPENRIYFMGWKSNAKHRLNAFKIKSNRFILPLHKSYSSFAHGVLEAMSDFDKVFCFLDGKQYDPKATNTLRYALETNPSISERFTTEYFDYRFYAATGSIHLFPRRKDLIERLNNIVGKLRKWIPEQAADATPDFWDQYKQADKINGKKQFTAGMSKVSKYALREICQYEGVKSYNHANERELETLQALDASYIDAAKEEGIVVSDNFDARLSSDSGQLLLSDCAA